jgi:chromosome segregation ATPase
MKLLRIRLRDFRGVVDRQVEFDPTGVTVVEGPNEIGKSCIAEAFDLLLDELDSSSKRSVLAAKPVDRDAGPDVEAEFETGRYRLRFRKRFVRRQLTELEILAPKHENLTGRQAHERVRSILGETLDDGLWRAMRIQQGSELQQPELRTANSLSAALDRAAGSVPAAPEELALYDRVREQYQLYWTDTGRAKMDRGALERDAQGASNLVVEVEGELSSLESDIERYATTETTVNTLEPKLAEQVGLVASRLSEVARLDHVAQKVRALNAEADAAAAGAEKVARADADRRELVQRVAVQVRELDVTRSTVGEGEPDLLDSRAQHEKDLAAVAQARASRDGAEALARVLRTDVTFLRDGLQAKELRRRSEAIRNARAALATVQAELDGNRVDDAALSKLRTADTRLRTARAAFGAARPSIRLEASVDTMVEVDGERVALEVGTPFEKVLPAEAKVTVPGLLTMTVVPGTADRSLDKELLVAEREFKALCSDLSVGGIDYAESAASDRRRLEASRSEQDQALHTALDGQTLGDLEQTLADSEARVEQYEKARPSAPAIARDLAAAEWASADGEDRLSAATQLVKETEAAEEASRKRLAALESEANQHIARLQVDEETVRRLESSLSAAREQASDQALADAFHAASLAAELARESARKAQDELDMANPEETRVLAENAGRVLEGMKAELRAAQDDRIAINTRLGEHGEAGLGERRDQAILARDAAADALATYDRRAAARKVLYETMKTARERTRAAYVGPLQDGVDALGRIVFGPSFQVCIDESLAIESRTLSGKTIPLASLSAGTREQLAVILRLACATVVASDGGVPVILDDVLGYSDPRRLEAMGAVLSEAGRTSQVIVFTCYPDRYRQVGGAHVLRLD